EGADHLLGLARLEAEVGLAAFDAVADDFEAGRVPFLDLVDLEASHDGRQDAEEGHRRLGRYADQAVGELDEAAGVNGVDFLKGVGAVREHREDLAADAAGDASGEVEVAGSFFGGDLAKEVGAALEVEV